MSEIRAVARPGDVPTSGPTKVPTAEELADRLDMENRRKAVARAKETYKPPQDALYAATHPDEAGPLYMKIDPTDKGAEAISGWIPRGTDAIADQYRGIADSAVATRKQLRETLAAIDTDVDLSETGRAKKRAEAYEEATKGLALAARELDRHSRVVREQVTEPLSFVEAYKPGDTAQVAIDLAMAQHFGDLQGGNRDKMMQRLLSTLVIVDQRAGKH